MYVVRGTVAEWFSQAGTNVAAVWEATGGFTWSAAQAKATSILRSWGWSEVSATNDSRGLVIRGKCPVDFSSELDVSSVFAMAAQQAGFFLTGKPSISLFYSGTERGGVWGGQQTPARNQSSGQQPQPQQSAAPASNDDKSKGGGLSLPLIVVLVVIAVVARR